MATILMRTADVRDATLVTQISGPDISNTTARTGTYSYRLGGGAFGFRFRHYRLSIFA